MLIGSPRSSQTWVSNALRYTPAGGQVTVRAFIETPPDRQRQTAETAVVGGQSSVVVAVTDTGTGIAPEDLPHIFDRFYRADKSRARANSGSGLRLSIVKHLIEAHGGQAGAESPVFGGPEEYGYGTRVSFTLPITKLANAPDTTAVPPPGF